LGTPTPGHFDRILTVLPEGGDYFVILIWGKKLTLPAEYENSIYFIDYWRFSYQLLLSVWKGFEE
jgi:hypothetical protein